MDRVIETRHGRMHARVEGDGPAVVLAHGYHPENDWRVWENNLAALAAAGYRVYALDLIGYGESGGERLGQRQQAQADAGSIARPRACRRLPWAGFRGAA
jgi:pimeloyl-ACP methyl ester carboxylesterase